MRKNIKKQTNDTLSAMENRVVAKSDETADACCYSPMYQWIEMLNLRKLDPFLGALNKL
jgi:hypothetical protein